LRGRRIFPFAVVGKKNDLGTGHCPCRALAAEA